MSYYNDVYLKRLNRFGNDAPERINNQRAREFEDYLEKSIYRIDFMYQSVSQPAILKQYKQDETQTLSYLLTKKDLQLPAGTYVNVTDNQVTTHWIVLWHEFDISEGYSRHVLIKANYQLSWKHNNTTYTQWAYFSGPAKSKIQDTIKSNSNATVFSQDDNLYLFIAPWSNNIDIGDYFKLTIGTTDQAFVVTEFDICSTPGIGYISTKPHHIKAPDTTTLPDNTNNFWLTGGANGNT